MRKKPIKASSGPWFTGPVRTMDGLAAGSVWTWIPFKQFLAGILAAALASICAHATGFRYDDARNWARPLGPASSGVCEAQDYRVTSRQNRFAPRLADCPEEDHQPRAAAGRCSGASQRGHYPLARPCGETETALEPAPARARVRIELDLLASLPQRRRQCSALVAQVGSRHRPVKGCLTAPSDAFFFPGGTHE